MWASWPYFGCALGDQEARVGVGHVVEPDALELRADDHQAASGKPVRALARVMPGIMPASTSIEPNLALS